MRQPLPDFLSKHTVLVPSIIESKRDAGFELLIYSARGRYRIYCNGMVDYAIRPHDPRYLMGGPSLQWSADDPKLLSLCFQEEIAWAEAFEEELPPPRRFQIITINQSYVIAESFEIESIPIPPEQQQFQSEYPPYVAQANQPTPLEPIDWNSLQISFKHLSASETKQDSNS